MRQVLGAKTAKVKLTVPPTMAADDWSVDEDKIRVGGKSSNTLRDREPDSDNNNEPR